MSSQLVKKHRASTRIWHWVNAVAIVVLLMSGLMISNAHPHLYWGQYGADLETPWYSPPRFPGWATIPSTYNLALGRLWHLAFAWVFAVGLLAYLITSLINRHIQRDLTLHGAELRPAHLWQDVKDHARLKFPTGQEALKYNVIQKMTYIAVIFVLIPLLIATGLCMSPGFNAIAPWLVDLFGGRATARSIHFVLSGAMALFIAVHILLVLLSGPYNQIRSMITGRFRIEDAGQAA